MLNENATIQYVLAHDTLKSVITEIISEYLQKQEEDNVKENLLSAAQVSSRLGVAKSTLWRWEKEGYLTPVRIGTKLRYKESDIQAMMEGRKYE